MPSPSPGISFSRLPPRRRLGATLSRRDWRGVGADLVMDFWASSSSASRRRCLQCRRGDGGGCAGVAAAGLSREAGRWLPWPVRALRMAEGGSGVNPRLHRRSAPDSVVEDQLGDDPRPVSHSDMRASLMLLLSRFLMPLVGDGAASSSAQLDSVRSSRAARLAGDGEGRRIGSGGAEVPGDLFVFSSFLGGFSAICMGLGVLLGLSVSCVRVLYSSMSTT